MYAKKQLEMKKELNSSNNMNAKLMNEIQFMKQMQNNKNQDNSDNLAYSKDYQSILQQLKQERSKNLELYRKLEETKNRLNQWENSQVEKQKQDAFETMIVFIEQILQNNQNSQPVGPHQRANWEDEVGALLNDYQDDLKLLQDKYLQQLCVLYSKNLPKIDKIDQEFLNLNPQILIII